MSLETDRDCPEWTIFVSVQPLFVSELPWRTPKLNGDDTPQPAAEAIGIDTFTKCFSADMKTTTALFPKHRLSEQDYQSFIETLLDLLDFLESLVREGVRRQSSSFAKSQLPCDTNQEKPSTDAIQQQEASFTSTISSWLQGIMSPPDVLPLVDTTTEFSTYISPSQHEEERKHNDTEQMRFKKLKALGAHVETCLTNDWNLENEGQYKAFCFNQCELIIFINLDESLETNAHTRLHKEKGQFITNMCDTIHINHSPRFEPQPLRLLFDTTHLWNASVMNEEQSWHNAYPAVSLQDLLNDGFLLDSDKNGAFKSNDKATGKPIKPGNHGMGNVEEDLKETLWQILEDREDEFARGHYDDAVTGCLQFEVALSLECEKHPETDLELLVPGVLYRAVVLHLEKNMCLVRNPQQALSPKNLCLKERTTQMAHRANYQQYQDNSSTKAKLLDHSIDTPQSPPQFEHVRADSFISVLMDDSEEHVTQGDSKKASIARTFLTQLATFNRKHMLQKIPQTVTKTRICIIDTGLDMSDPVIRGLKRRVVGGYSWVDEDPHTYDDACGHGTHIARLVLTTSTTAEILIAKVSSDKTFSDRNFESIPLAIRWAMDNGAEIISLSLGFRESLPEIQDILQEAISPEDDEAQPILVFAAAGNWGLNFPRAFPSSEKGVFCIYASDGNGYGENINPRDEGENSFTTLGVAIESAWQNQELLISGTSYATPIAAGIAANILDFGRCTMNLGKGRMKKLGSYQGMRSVLRLMTPVDQSSNYLCPWQLGVKGLKTNAQIGKAIKDAIDLG
ncbi:Nn.00g071540.m01.CDS01 [Neocucurbitaria sp. VM-36]